jgi:dihydrodipicolinate synthase/N-acetylneuraminate lyase
MAVLSSPRGLIVDLITPLKKSGDIDGLGLSRHLDGVLPYAQALLLASPRIGEGKELSAEQREELLDKTLGPVQGRIPLLIWITQDTAEKTKETHLLLKRRLVRRKYSGRIFWVDTPLYYHSNRGLPLYYKDMVSTDEDSFLLYNDPELVKQIAPPLKRVNLRTSILKDLCGIRGIQGMVFLGALDRARNYQKAVRTRGDFKIYDGDESHFLKYPSLSGVVSVGANLAPNAWQKATSSSLNLNGIQQSYPDHLQQIWDLGWYLHDLKEVYQESPVSLIKQVLSERGVIEAPRCTVEGETSGEQLDRLKSLMERHGDYF